MDAIYTPPELAEFLAAASSLASPESIADFAAGDGALLQAAAHRWPEAHLFGSDIEEAAVSAISSRLPQCDTLLFDFLREPNAESLADQSFDLILLNPPFSCRGNSRHNAEIGGTNYSASKALVFVARALRFLKDCGELIAILPASILLSERDAALLAAIRDWGSVEQIGDIRKSAFKSHAVAVAVLRITKKPKLARSANEKPQLVSLRPYAVEMHRGSLSVHNYKAVRSGPQFIHTTDMRGGRILPSGRKASSNRRQIRGPAVLIPRVGRPSVEKIVVMPKRDAVLSDCVIAMRTVPAGNEFALAELISENWDTFKTAYGGSCAPYSTLKRLADALLRIGVASSIWPDARDGKQIGGGEEPVAPIAHGQKRSHG